MRAKLRTKTPAGKAPRVDRTGNGRILGASLMEIGPAIGHGFEIDGTTIDQAAALTEGTPGRWTHGSLCADGLGTHLGKWRNVRREGDRAVGDFEFSQLAKSVRPAGLSVDAATYLMDLAENEPDVAGVSAVIDYELVDGEPLKQGDGPRKLARLSRVLRADYVSDPAANARGMFSDSPSALAEQATAALADATEIHGRERVTAFLSAYLASANPKQSEVTVTLEELKKQHAAELAAALAGKDASIAALTATVAEFKATSDKRRTDEIEGYVSSLKAQAVPTAIDETKLGHVRALLSAGMDEAAKAFGATLLANAKSTAPAAGTTVSELGARSEDLAEAAKRGQSRLFEAAGIQTKAAGK